MFRRGKAPLILSFVTGLFLLGCTGRPEGVYPVEAFELEKYLGKWYEIARLDHSFERGLRNVTAEYTLKNDGTVGVVNRGYSEAEQGWKVAEGKADFVGRHDIGHLKVSFFGPFYGSYIIFELEREAYSYAFVTGPDTSYLWLLARAPQVDRQVIDQFLDKSKALGFATDGIIFVEQY